MWNYIWKMLINIVFAVVLYIVSYTNRDSNAILQVQHLKQFFFNSRSSTYNFSRIISITDYWQWLQKSFIPNIRLQSWYNGGSVVNMTDFLGDKSSRMIGWATMRQLRVKLNASCEIPAIVRMLIDSCKDTYSFFTDERQSYVPGWALKTNLTYPASIGNAFRYSSSQELDSYPYLGHHGMYGSGGYVYDFRGDFDELQANIALLRNLSWIDEQSRAVMIQLSLYNPNVNFFTSVTLLVEILTTGQAFPSSRIEPMQIYTAFNDFSSIFYLVIASIYMLFIISFTAIEIRAIYKRPRKYIRQIRSYMEWAIIAFSWSGMAVYIWRYREAHRIGKYFSSTNGLQYINLQLATYANDVLTFLLGFCCFFGTLRLLRLFDVYPRIDVFSRTLRRAFRELVAFTMMYFLLFSAFVVLFYLLFVSKMLSSSSILLTASMLFEMILLKFDTTDLVNADSFLGPFVFALFIYYCVFVGFTMFVVIITEHFRLVRKEIHQKESNQPGIFAFIIEDLSKRLGWKKFTASVFPEPIQVAEPVDPQTPVEELPAKIDQLVLALDRIHMSDARLDSMISSKDNEKWSIGSIRPWRRRRKKKRVIY